MAYTAEQLQSLLDLRARGVLSTRDSAGRMVTYQSGEALDAAIAAARRDVAAAEAAANNTQPRARRYGSFARG